MRLFNAFTWSWQRTQFTYDLPEQQLEARWSKLGHLKLPQETVFKERTPATANWIQECKVGLLLAHNDCNRNLDI